MTQHIGRAVRPAFLLVPLLLGSCFLLPREEEVLAPPLAEPPTITYRTEPVRLGSVERSIRAFGSFISARQSDLYFESRGGRLKRIYVAIGGTVEAGELAADMYTETLEAEIAQAELSLRRAQIAQRRVQEQQADRYTLELARADGDLSRLRLQELEADLERELDLARVTGGTGERVRTLERQIEEQRIAVRKAEIGVERIESQRTPIDVEMAQIDLEAAELRLRTLDAQLEATRLYAPIAGVVTWISRTAQEGENIQAFQRFIRIADPQDLMFEYQGRDAREFRLGMECVITVDNEDYRGVVVLTETSVPFDQREEYRETVHIAVSPVPADVRLGQTATARLVLARRDDVLVLPARAVQRYATRRYVHVLVNGVRVERDVEIGLETPTEVEIVRGLEEGEEVVLR